MPKMTLALSDVAESIEVAADVIYGALMARMSIVCEIVSVKINFDTDVLTIKYRTPDNSLGQLARDLHLGNADLSFEDRLALDH